MARLAGEVEDEIAILNQDAKAVAIPDVGDVQPYTTADVIDVVKIAAEVVAQTVHQEHFAAELHEPPRQARPDESNPACDEHFRPRERAMRRLVVKDQRRPPCDLR